MKTRPPTSSLQARLVPAQPAVRGPFAGLQRVINTAGLVSVDLTDTVFAALPRRDGAPYEAVAKRAGQHAA